MGIMMPETCWVNLKVNKHLYLYHLLVLSSPMFHTGLWKLHLKYLCNLAMYWLPGPWGWHDSVETCSSVIICEIIVLLLVIVQNNNRRTVQLLKLTKIKYWRMLCWVDYSTLGSSGCVSWSLVGGLHTSTRFHGVITHKTTTWMFTDSKASHM